MVAHVPRDMEWHQCQMEGSTDVNLHTDASGSQNYWAWTSNLWLKLAWPKGKVEEWPIAVKEIVPITLAGLLWGKRWCGKLVLAHCNNLAVVQVINAGYCKNPNLMQHVRSLFVTGPEKINHVSAKKSPTFFNFALS